MVKLSWKNVMDSSETLAGTHISMAQAKAKEVGYDYFAFNGRIYRVSDLREVGFVSAIDKS